MPTYHLGKTHVFSNRDGEQNAIIDIKAGQNETLRIQGTVEGTIVGNEWCAPTTIPEGIQTGTEQEVSRNVATASEGTYAALSGNFAFAPIVYGATTYENNIYEKTGSTWAYREDIALSCENYTGFEDVEMYTDRILFCTNTNTYILEYTSGTDTWAAGPNANPLGDTGTLGSIVANNAILYRANNVYMIERTATWDTTASQPAAGATAVAINTTNCLVGFSGSQTVLVYDYAFSLQSTLTPSVADPNYGKFVKSGNTYFAVASDNKLYIYDVATYTLQDTITYANTIDAIAVERTTGELISVLSNGQTSFILYDSALGIWDTSSTPYATSGSVSNNNMDITNNDLLLGNPTFNTNEGSVRFVPLTTGTGSALVVGCISMTTSNPGIRIYSDLKTEIQDGDSNVLASFDTGQSLVNNLYAPTGTIDTLTATTTTSPDVIADRLTGNVSTLTLRTLENAEGDSGNIILSTADVSSNAGDLTIVMGSTTGALQGGSINCTLGSGGAIGGGITFNGGQGGTTGTGGSFLLQTGQGGSTSGNSGALTLLTGAVTSGVGGEILLTVGDSVGTGNAGSNIELRAGDGGTNANGGSIELTPGAGAGTGTDGVVLVTGSTSITETMTAGQPYIRLSGNGGQAFGVGTNNVTSTYYDNTPITSGTNAPSYSSPNITINEGGHYYIKTGVKFSSAGASSVELRIRVNGTHVCSDRASIPSGNFHSLQTSTLLNLSSGDVITAAMTCDSNTMTGGSDEQDMVVTKLF